MLPAHAAEDALAGAEGAVKELGGREGEGEGEGVKRLMID